MKRLGKSGSKEQGERESSSKNMPKSEEKEGKEEKIPAVMS